MGAGDRWVVGIRGRRSSEGVGEGVGRELGRELGGVSMLSQYISWISVMNGLSLSRFPPPCLPACYYPHSPSSGTQPHESF
jgi:hypothetical protein